LESKNRHVHMANNSTRTHIAFNDACVKINHHDAAAHQPRVHTALNIIFFSHFHVIVIVAALHDRGEISVERGVHADQERRRRVCRRTVGFNLGIGTTTGTEFAEHRVEQRARQHGRVRVRPLERVRERSQRLGRMQQLRVRRGAQHDAALCVSEEKGGKEERWSS
jgi:hypothetical protein